MHWILLVVIILININVIFFLICLRLTSIIESHKQESELVKEELSTVLKCIFEINRKLFYTEKTND